MANRDAKIADQKQRIGQLEQLLSQLVTNPQNLQVPSPRAESVPVSTSTPVVGTTSAVATENDVPQSARKLETIISFGTGRVVVDAPQFPNVERVAFYLKVHPRARVEVRGYASPDGPLATNIHCKATCGSR